MKSRLLKCAVLVSALAFMNCGDDATTAPNLNPNGVVPGIASSSDAANPTLSSSSVEAPDVSVPTSSADVSIPASSADAPASSAEVQNPVSSADVVPASSDAAPASSADAPTSSVAAPASSSSEAVKPASSATVASSSSEAQQPAGIFLPENKEEEKDVMQVEYKENTGWDGKGILAYPKQLSSTQKHGVVVWGPGGGTEPGAYGGMIRRLASHGFVVIALSVSPGDASQATKAIDWLEQKNKDSNDPLYQKLELTKVGCSGHSMGGLESEQAAIKDKRVFTAFLNNSGDKNGGVIKNFPEGKTAAVLYGEVGMEKPNAIKDYETATNVKSCLIEMTGGPKNNSEGGYGHGSGSWDGMAATIAWMRWQIGGEDFRKADFVGTSGKYIDGNIVGHQGKWKTQCKNF